MKLKTSPLSTALLSTALLAGLVAPAAAQGGGGLYIAGPQTELGVALDQALAANPGPGRFFVLVLPPAQQALAGPGGAALRQQLATVRERGGELMVCRGDVETGAIKPAQLGSPVTVARGWPPREGGLSMIPGTNLYPGDDPAKFPPSHVQMRRLRSACT